MFQYPSGRVSTHIPANIRPWLVVPKSGDIPHPVLIQDAWLRAKECQTLEDGTSARIPPEQLARLEASINGTPLSKAGSAEVFLLSRHNNLCRKLGYLARTKGGAQ